MSETRQPSPVVTFYQAVPGCRAPTRADSSVLGTLPSRGFQYCEALRAASSFGWYVFPPIDFTLQWDGSEIIWTYRGAKAWYPLQSTQFPGFQARFDRAAPKRLRGFAPPFLTAVPEPGIVQLWTGLMVGSAEDWSILVRPPANLPRALDVNHQDHIAPGPKVRLRVRLTRPVEVAEHVRPLEEGIRGNHLLEP